MKTDGGIEVLEIKYDRKMKEQHFGPYNFPHGHHDPCSCFAKNHDFLSSGTAGGQLEVSYMHF